MYYHLGADLTQRQQRQLTRAQKQVTRLTPIVAAAEPGKRKPARKRLARAQEIIARLTQVSTPPITVPTTPEPGTTPESPISVLPEPTPVWMTEPGPAPTTEPDTTESIIESVTTAASQDTLVSGIPNAFLILGAIGLFMLLPRRRV